MCFILDFIISHYIIEMMYQLQMADLESSSEQAYGKMHTFCKQMRNSSYYQPIPPRQVCLTKSRPD